MVEIQETCPPDDRTAERRVFPGFTPDVAHSVMARACVAAGIAHFHPHDLRHRYASVKIAEGVPVTDLARSWGTRGRASRSTPTRTFWSTRCRRGVAWVRPGPHLSARFSC
jgi:integrase